MQVDMHIDFARAPWRERWRLILRVLFGRKALLQIDIAPRGILPRLGPCDCSYCTAERAKAQQHHVN